ncbi:T9SS type A sorting domain-containing protein [bacterium SCSIO 12643]|nr:T9SS type A sorting domain-containing protein [bacterium SCSIO 12643]
MFLYGGQINGQAKVLRRQNTNITEVIEDKNLGNIVSDFEINDNGTEIYAAINLISSSAILDGVNSVSAQGDAVILKASISSTWQAPSYIKEAKGSNVIINDIDIGLDDYDWLTAVGTYNGTTPNWSTRYTQITSNTETALIAQFNKSNLSNSGTYQLDGDFTSASATAVTTDYDDVMVTGIIKDGDWYSIDANGSQNSTSSVGSGPGVNTMWAAKFSSGPTQTTWLTGAVSTQKSMVVNDIVYDAGTDLFFIGGGYGDNVSFYPHSQLLFPSSIGSDQLGYVIRGVSSTAFFHKTALGNETDQQLSDVENIVTMYPNPNNGTFNLNIQSETTGTLQITIYNVNGTKVYSNEYDKSSHSFDQQLSISDLTSGIYMMHISINGTTQYQKFMVK